MHICKQSQSMTMMVNRITRGTCIIWITLSDDIEISNRFQIQRRSVNYLWQHHRLYPCIRTLLNLRRVNFVTFLFTSFAYHFIRNELRIRMCEKNLARLAVCFSNKPSHQVFLHITISCTEPSVFSVWFYEPSKIRSFARSRFEGCNFATDRD